MAAELTVISSGSFKIIQEILETYSKLRCWKCSYNQVAHTRTKVGSQWSCAICSVVCTPFPMAVTCIFSMFPCAICTPAFGMVFERTELVGPDGHLMLSYNFILQHLPRYHIVYWPSRQRCDLLNRARQPPLSVTAWCYWHGGVCFSLPASVTLVLLLTSPLRLCLYLPCPRHSSRRVFYKPSPHKSAQSIVPSTHQDWKIVSLGRTAPKALLNHSSGYLTAKMDRTERLWFTH